MFLHKRLRRPLENLGFCAKTYKHLIVRHCAAPRQHHATPARHRAALRENIWKTCVCTRSYGNIRNVVLRKKPRTLAENKSFCADSCEKLRIIHVVAHKVAKAIGKHMLLASARKRTKPAKAKMSEVVLKTNLQLCPATWRPATRSPAEADRFPKAQRSSGK